ncbi:MAG TPA: M1 family aminopeptidase [Nocardioides sp.]|nr:M1 family aminopeptidase [Nocardioides sp.]
MLRRPTVALVSALLLTAALAASSGAATAGPASGARSGGPCTPGARTLSHLGDHVYPDMGNGGYTSLHTDVHLVYDAPSNLFLDGNEVVLTDRATHCLSDFSLDLERSNALGADGPDLTVQSVTVDGVPATRTFVQPTYPGDPNGPDDPDPLAHQASQVTPVGGPDHNPLPPACSPQVTGSNVNAQNGDPCPANKLVITPATPIADGQVFSVTVAYTGRPGVHLDGDGSTEGWFRNDTPAGDGSFVTTEPVGTEDWMPLNNHPSAKPTYDFYERVNAGRKAIANGRLVGKTHYQPDSRFPGGSTLFHWRSGAPVASYLVESSIGTYDLSARQGPHGVRYYQAQAGGLSHARQRANRAVMDRQPAITRFQSRFNGPFPFPTDGVLVGIPNAGFEEEMQTMITFAGGRIDLATFHHENMHQWWGDNVSEANFDLTFFKEGMATLGGYLFRAQQARRAAGGGTHAGHRAFQRSLVKRFDINYGSSGLFGGVPSDPTPARLFSGSSTYERPGTAYLALRQVLGHHRFVRALHRIQRDYAGSSITERQLEREFAHLLPDRSQACQARLGHFFTQWFDTAYPSGGVHRPRLTGPGLAGRGFYDAHGRCQGPPRG